MKFFPKMAALPKSLFFYLFFVPLFAGNEIQLQEFCPEYEITSEQKLKSPSFPRYHPFVRCWYNISAPSKDSVAVVSFGTFDLPFAETTGVANVLSIYYKDCRTDYVEIQMQNGETRRFCGNELQRMKIFSTTGKIKFIFQSLSKFNGAGFQASVKFIPLFNFFKADHFCNSVLLEPKDYTVQSLPDRKDCKFAVKTPEGKRPEVKFSSNDCLQFTIDEGINQDNLRTNAEMCDDKWWGQRTKNSYRLFSISLSSGGAPRNVKITVRHTVQEDDCAKYLKQQRNGYNIKFQYLPDRRNKFPSICIWLIDVPKSTSTVDINYNMDLLEANDGICTRDQLVFAEVFEDYTRNAYTLNPTCGKLQGESTGVGNSNYNKGNTTLMVMAAIENDTDEKMRTIEMEIKF
uniref:Scol-pM12A n=1 Tax=Scolopendra viridis TaxID=118503 RepID=A0A4D5R8W7_SCOVI